MANRSQRGWSKQFELFLIENKYVDDKINTKRDKRQTARVEVLYSIGLSIESQPKRAAQPFSIRLRIHIILNIDFGLLTKTGQEIKKG